MTYRNKMVHDLINETDIAWNMFLNYLKTSNYFNICNKMDEKERRYYNNKLCSDLAVICEKYSKALYLKTSTIPNSIISRLNLNDDDVINIIIGSDDSRTKTIYGKLTKDEKREIQELKLQGVSHNFIKLLNDNNKFLQNVQQYFYLALNDLKNISNNDLENILFSDKVYDAFVKGRYSSLNDYNGDFEALITLCETLQKKIIQGENFGDMDCVEILPSSNFDLVNDFYNYKKNIPNHTNIYGGYQPRFRMIKHIYPTLGSTITIDSNGEKKDYCFGEHKSVSLYKFVTSGDKNIKIKKSVEELYNEIVNAPTHIGLYSLQHEEAKNIIELNEVSNLSGLVIDDGSTVTFDEGFGIRVISNIGGQLIMTNYELMKQNNDNKEI